MAGTLTVHKIKSKTPSGKWFTAEVAAIEVVRGQIYFILKNQKYQHLKVTAADCIIVK